MQAAGHFRVRKLGEERSLDRLPLVGGEQLQGTCGANRRAIIKAAMPPVAVSGSCPSILTS